MKEQILLEWALQFLILMVAVELKITNTLDVATKHTQVYDKKAIFLLGNGMFPLVESIAEDTRA